MRLSVHHATRYRFTRPQARIVQQLRMFPSDTTHQTVVNWRIDVDCDARLRSAVDGFGNATRMLYAEGPLVELCVTVSGEVLLTEDDGAIEGTSEPFPPEMFLRRTQLTMPNDAIRALSAGTDASVDGLSDLARRISERYELDRRPSRTIRSAAEAVAEARVAPRDLAQLFVTAAREVGVPARYVSGYSLSGDGERRTASPHAWVEGFVDGPRGGWYAFDPVTGGRSGLDHVRVAVALDAAGAAAIAGTRIGQGDEMMDVDVHLSEQGGD